MAFVKYSRPNPMHLYEMNYFALMQLVPELEDQSYLKTASTSNTDEISQFLSSSHFNSTSNFHVNFKMDEADLTIRLIEVNKYTQHIQIVNTFKQDKKLIPTLCLNVRVYHDVSLAEVISCSGVGKLQPNYIYPNEQMLLKDEKRQANRLLFEWLSSAKTFYRFEPETQRIC